MNEGKENDQHPQGFPTRKAVVVKQPKPNGRPSIRTKEVEDAILACIRKGISLGKICNDPNLPCRDTVFDWLSKDEARRAAKEVKEGEVLFLDRYNIATKIRTSVMAEEILEIADDGRKDTYTDQAGTVVIDKDHIQRSRLRVDTRKWLMAKMEPKKYGDRPAETHVSTTISNGGFAVMSPERLAELQEVRRKALEGMKDNRH